MNSFQITNQDRLLISQNWGWFLAWGMALIVLGVFALSLATLTTIISVIFFGVLILITGVVLIIDAVKFWWKRWNGFFLHLAIGILYVIVGVMLIESPVLASVSLTLLLGLFYLLLGVFRIINSLSLQTPSWGWALLNGLVSLLLGIFIMASWPASGIFIIGIFIGIDLVFSGWAYVMMALAAKENPTKLEKRRR